MSEPGFRHVLAFDCSGAACSAAVRVDGGLVAERFAAMARGQAEALLPQIRSVMADAGMDFADLDAIATTIGPGSFTGLRLGLAAARGLVLAAGLPLVAVTGFEALLAGLSDDRREGRPVAVFIDSRRGPVFAQLFDAGLLPSGPPATVESAAVDRWLPPGPVAILADSGAQLPQPAPDRALWRAAIRAGDIARLAAGPGSAERVRRDPVPLYLRAPDATLPRQRTAP
jgi:tRNA threonylcarbamoyladenosine biosynthesis protein TsaB